MNLEDDEEAAAEHGTHGTLEGESPATAQRD